MQAAPTDFQIVCNFNTQEITDDTNLQILPIKEIRNHPKFNPITNTDTLKGGPIDGYDISVYIVDDSEFKMDADFVWPACLPRRDDGSSYLPGNRGILSGWLAPPPLYLLSQSTTVLAYELNYLYEKEALYEKVPCADPDWMQQNSNTFYPAGASCYADAAAASAVEFGNSGSGIMRPFRSAGRQAESAVRYSWAGVLSMSKGANYPIFYTQNNISFIELMSNNPTVFTDASCYLDWIADQYNLRLPADYTLPPHCSQSSGSREDVNRTRCVARNLDVAATTRLEDVHIVQGANPSLPRPLQYCNFYLGPGPEFEQFNQCRLFFNNAGKPKLSRNFFYCVITDENGRPSLAACANNCRGVDPNAVVVGGTAALLSLATAAASLGPDLLGSALGAGSLVALLGVGSMAMNATRSNSCPPPRCRSGLNQRCCLPTLVNGRRVCPLQC